MSEERCICCGDIIPEGLQVCPTCKSKIMETKQKRVKRKDLHNSIFYDRLKKSHN